MGPNMKGNGSVEGLLSDGTIAPSQASTMGHVNQVIGEASMVVIGQPSGEPLFYSQPRSASAGSNVQEQLFLSQHGASTAPYLPRPKAKPIRKSSTPQRRVIVRKNSISTPAIQSAWQNLMESRPR
ncbi:Uncharacterized protein Fot_38275 [Forsythia ovata]|uniref:Uncharacterized protein n=1 Tax=Forsythia ovata TaxID=205694 RepID=A0ABD1S209_9LAMI